MYDGASDHLALIENARRGIYCISCRRARVLFPLFPPDTEIRYVSVIGYVLSIPFVRHLPRALPTEIKGLFFLLIHKINCQWPADTYLILDIFIVSVFKYKYI